MESELNVSLNRMFQKVLAAVNPPKKKVARKRSPAKPKTVVSSQPEFDFGETDAS